MYMSHNINYYIIQERNCSKTILNYMLGKAITHTNNKLYDWEKKNCTSVASATLISTRKLKLNYVFLRSEKFMIWNVSFVFSHTTNQITENEE